MASEERQPFRPRLRFGFSGPASKRTKEEAGVDDFLDSLSRRTSLGGEIDKETSVLMGETVENIDPDLETSGFGLSSRMKVSVGKIVLALILVGGVALLWLYGALGGLTDPLALDNLTRSEEIASIFSDPFKLGLLVLVSLVPILLLRRKHRAEAQLLYR